MISFSYDFSLTKPRERSCNANVLCAYRSYTRYRKSQENRRRIVVHGLLHPMCCCRRSFFEGLFQPTTVYRRLSKKKLLFALPHSHLPQTKPMVMVQSAAPPDRQHVIHVRRAASGLGPPWLWRSLLRACFPCPCRGRLRGWCSRSAIRTD